MRCFDDIPDLDDVVKIQKRIDKEKEEKRKRKEDEKSKPLTSSYCILMHKRYYSEKRGNTLSDKCSECPYYDTEKVCAHIDFFQKISATYMYQIKDYPFMTTKQRNEIEKIDKIKEKEQIKREEEIKRKKFEAKLKRYGFPLDTSEKEFIEALRQDVQKKKKAQ